MREEKTVYKEADLLNFEKELFQNPSDEKATEILKKLNSAEVSDPSIVDVNLAELAYKMFNEMVVKYHSDAFLDEALKFVEKRVSHFDDEYYYSQCRNMLESVSIALAENNIDKPEVVEACLEHAQEKCPIEFQSMLYESLAFAGYEENDFLSRYAQKLNDGLFAPVGNYDIIAKMADKLDTSVLKDATENAGNQIYEDEKYRRQYHVNSRLADEDYENLDKLTKLVDSRLKLEAITKAKNQKNPPAEIYVETYAGDTYGDWAEHVYIKDEKGEYVPTDICDELHFGNEDSEARVQMKLRGNLVRVPDGIYYRDNANEDFKPLEKNPDCSYRVLDNNTFWRDVKSDGLRFSHRGAVFDSVLVSKNPVTGKFEDIHLNVDRAHGDFLEGKIFDEEDKTFKTAMYKRNYKNGQFELDAKFPLAECSYCDGRNPSRIFISFKTDDGTCYIYGADKKHSSLVKMQGDTKVKIDRFSNEPLGNINKTHKQKPFKNLAELMKAKGENEK